MTTEKIIRLVFCAIMIIILVSVAIFVIVELKKEKEEEKKINEEIMQAAMELYKIDGDAFWICGTCMYIGYSHCNSCPIKCKVVSKENKTEIDE